MIDTRQNSTCTDLWDKLCCHRFGQLWILQGWLLQANHLEHALNSSGKGKIKGLASNRVNFIWLTWMWPASTKWHVRYIACFNILQDNRQQNPDLFLLLLFLFTKTRNYTLSQFENGCNVTAHFMLRLKRMLLSSRMTTKRHSWNIMLVHLYRCVTTSHPFSK